MVVGDGSPGGQGSTGAAVVGATVSATTETNTTAATINGSQQKKPPNQPTPLARPTKCYYIDELGFYRHLDPDQRQYVCSNMNSSVPLAEPKQSLSSRSDRVRAEAQALISGADGGYEICYKAVRHELGISHFDRIENHANWKRGWDEFMRAKLTSRQPVTLNRVLKLRVRSGVPHDYRCKVWSALIRMRTKAIRSQFSDDIYEQIVRDYVSTVSVPKYHHQQSDANNNLNSNSNSDNKKSTLSTSVAAAAGQLARARLAQGTLIDKCFKQIELDLLRTLPNNRHFEEPNSRGIQRVRRVLRAYACFNQSVGYCQGMNRLAAMALLVLPEEEAFWCLVAIIQCIMPKDYYLRPWLAQVDCSVLSDLLEKKMPKLHKHLQRNDIQLTLFTWFFTIFVDGFRPELMLRIWDCFLLEGDKVLFRFALAILYLAQTELLDMHDLSTMSAHLSRLVSTRELDMERLFEAFEAMNPLSSATIETRRQFHRQRIQQTIDE